MTQTERLPRRLVDCAFGVGGAALLWPCLRAIRTLEARGAPRAAQG